MGYFFSSRNSATRKIRKDKKRGKYCLFSFCNVRERRKRIERVIIKNKKLKKLVVLVFNDKRTKGKRERRE